MFFKKETNQAPRFLLSSYSWSLPEKWSSYNCFFPSRVINNLLSNQRCFLQQICLHVKFYHFFLSLHITTPPIYTLNQIQSSGTSLSSTHHSASSSRNTSVNPRFRVALSDFHPTVGVGVGFLKPKVSNVFDLQIHGSNVFDPVYVYKDPQRVFFCSHKQPNEIWPHSHKIAIPHTICGFCVVQF